MKTIYKTTHKPLFSIYKRRPKAERAKVKPLFWLENHLFGGEYLHYVVIYMPKRFIILGWSVFREVQRYEVTP